MLLIQAPPPTPPAAVAEPTPVAPLIVTGVKPGTVRLSCAIRWNRTVDRCVVLSAEPENCGFGTAALRLAEHMRLDGEAAAKARGGKVEIPLSFSGIGGCPRPDTP